MIENYNPNFEWGKSVVEIVVMQWAYRHTFTVEVGGNCAGMTVLDCAVGTAFDGLPETGDGQKMLTLTNEKGDQLSCLDEEDRGDDWLKDMIVSAQIVAYKSPTLNEVRARNGAKPVKDGDKPYEFLG